MARILQELAGRLAEERTAERIAVAVARTGLQLPGDPSVTVGLADGPDGDLRILALATSDQEELDNWATIDRSAPVPLVDALVGGEPLYIESRVELLARYPALADEIERSDQRSWAVVPMVSAGGPAGAIGLAWPTERPVGETERLLLFTAAKLAGESLRRVLREEERRRLLLRVTDAADQERLAIAAGLHDDPVQRLAALSMRIGSLRAAGDPVDPGVLGDVEQGIQNVLATLRDLIFDLHPPDVSRLTLAQSVEDYATWLFADAIHTVVVDAVGDDLPGGYVRAAYRIIQEALNNVAKHAGASAVTVTLAVADGALVVLVDDDGRGMRDGQRQPERGHIGLQTVRERAESFGGSMATGASPAGGFRLRASLPIDRPAVG